MNFWNPVLQSVQVADGDNHQDAKVCKYCVGSDTLSLQETSSSLDLTIPRFGSDGRAERDAPVSCMEVRARCAVHQDSTYKISV